MIRDGLGNALAMVETRSAAVRVRELAEQGILRGDYDLFEYNQWADAIEGLGAHPPEIRR